MMFIFNKNECKRDVSKQRDRKCEKWKTAFSTESTITILGFRCCVMFFFMQPIYQSTYFHFNVSDNEFKGKPIDFCLTRTFSYLECAQRNRNRFCFSLLETLIHFLVRKKGGNWICFMLLYLKIFRKHEFIEFRGHSIFFQCYEINFIILMMIILIFKLKCVEKRIYLSS